MNGGIQKRFRNKSKARNRQNPLTEKKNSQPYIDSVLKKPQPESNMPGSSTRIVQN